MFAKVVRWEPSFIVVLRFCGGFAGSAMTHNRALEMNHCETWCRLTHPRLTFLSLRFLHCAMTTPPEMRTGNYFKIIYSICWKYSNIQINRKNLQLHLTVNIINLGYLQIRVFLNKVVTSQVYIKKRTLETVTGYCILCKRK